MKISFLGAAREVTGSCYLVETGAGRFLVDCGMVQGNRKAMARNRAPFDFDVGTIDFVLLTHAHIDHSGLLPKLVKGGYNGPIYTTSATADLLQVLLPDSAYIQESDAKRARRYAHGKTVEGAIPAYSIDDAKQALTLLQSVDYDTDVTPRADVRCRYRDAGHILGSAIIEVWVTEGDNTTKIVFSGDLGQPGRPILRDPTPIEDADILFIESTYGNRMHKSHGATLDELAEVVDNTLNVKGGNVIVPAFAVGRTQEILYHLHRLTRQGRLHDLKIFVDSPMATKATKITKKHFELFDEQARDLVDWHGGAEHQPYVNFTASVDESKNLNRIRSGAIIISASGMCNAGRIRHHLRNNLTRAQCSVLITGYQAEGTLGRRLVDGATTVRIFGDEIPVNASIHTLNGFSAHADQAALLDWTNHFKTAPKQVFVVHGEARAAEEFSGLLKKRYNWKSLVPEHGQTVEWNAQAQRLEQ
ncbi:MAG: MBL fold metallo-hydrolase [Rhodobacterales bacterium]|nr:MBL fold metallo-hydrolase [Rhodobacterales bacterium]